MHTITLPGQWILEAVGNADGVPSGVAGRAIPATVPGCVHTDLLAAGLIPDPHLDRNEHAVQWIGHTDWRYRCAFDITAETLDHDRVELACDGLDTVATVTLNGHTVGHSADMHTRQRFDAKSVLRVGRNELSITFASALAYAHAMREEHGDLPHTGCGSNKLEPHNRIRKMACHFGWDWGPTLITAGIWRDIRLEAWSTARIKDVRPLVTRADEDVAELEVHADLDTTHAPLLTLAATLTAPGGKTCKAQSDGSPLTIQVKNPQRWWPVGHGGQPLHTLHVTLTDQHGTLLDERTHRVGLRTTALLTEPDLQPAEGPVERLGQGAGMTLLVNGKPIFCKGANWIPDDLFLHRVTPARYRERITQARDAHMNMLRIWGGGVFESRDFYETCDELGVMVWQDFLCACAAYSEEEPYLSLIRGEARDNVARLARHPSLVLWNGCNENFMGFTDWVYDGKPWHECIAGRTWGSGYYLDVFPSIVRELSPATPYWPGSPYSGSPDLFDRRANLNEFGNRHIWDVWHGSGQYRNYLAHYPRFASEFGYHGPPTWPNIASSIPPDQWAWNSDAMNHHNKNSSKTPGQPHTHARMGDDFVQPDAPGSPGSSDAFDDWLYLAQVMQVRALDLGVSWFRALSPWCSGALYWQLNDCWPVSSWSAIDSSGNRKPLWYASRRFFAPRLLTIKPRAVTPQGSPVGGLALFAHNDTDTPWAGPATLRLMSVSGETLATHTATLNVPARRNHRFDIPDAWLDDTDQRFIAAEAADHDVARALWWFQPDKRLAYPEADFDAEVTARGGGYGLTIHAKSVLRDLCVFADRLDPDAAVSDQCVTLLPGDTFTFTVTSSRRMTVDELTRPPVMQTANRFGMQPAPV